MRSSTLLQRDGAALGAAAWALVYVVVALWWTRRGEALPPDSIDYAEVALALIRGQGPTINHVAFHTHLFPAVRHTLEVHGLLAPLELLPLFAIWGPAGGLVRVPSILFAGGLGLLAFRVGRELSGALAGWIALALVLGRTDLVYLSVLGADDVGAAFFGLLALYCFLRSRTQERRWILATGVASAVAGLQKFTGLLLPAAFGVFLLLGARRELGTPSTRKSWLYATMPVAATAGLYMIRNLHVYGALSLGSPYAGVEWLGKSSFPEYFAYYATPPTVRGAWAKLGSARVVAIIGEQLRAVFETVVSDPVLFIGLAALLWLVFRKPRFAVCAWLYIAGVVFILCVPYHVEPRYLSPLMPICAVAAGALGATAAAWLTNTVPQERRRWLRAAFGAALAALGVVGAYRAFALVRLLGEHMAKAGEACPDAIGYLRRTSTDGEPVLTSNPFFIAWNGGRPAVNAPTNGASALLTVARHYGVRWLFTGVPVIGALDLDAAVHDPRVAEGLHPVLEFHGAACDVYRVDPGAPP